LVETSLKDIPLSYQSTLFWGSTHEAFLAQKAQLTNRLTQRLITDFCNDGVIDWEKIVQLNSGNLDLPAYLEQT
jgi:hypothetical protein